MVSIATMSLYNYFTSKSKIPSKTTVQVAATQVNLTSSEEEEVLSALENVSQPSKESGAERLTESHFLQILFLNLGDVM